MDIFWIIFFLAGIALSGIGIYAKIYRYRMMHEGQLVNAVVVRSEAVRREFAGQEILLYENTLQIDTVQGSTYKILNEKHPRKIGKCVRGYYIEGTDHFMKEKDGLLNRGKNLNVLIGIGILWCAVILLIAWMERPGAVRQEQIHEKNGEPSEVTVEQFKSRLNEDGYCYQTGVLEVSDDEEYVEYYCLPDKEEAGYYGYRLIIYENGISELSLFPCKTVEGRYFNQSIAFYIDVEKLRQIGEMLDTYDFTALCNDQTESDDETTQYLYYYNGEERVGSGGSSFTAEPFDTVRDKLFAFVPETVWSVAVEEMRAYFE